MCYYGIEYSRQTAFTEASNRFSHDHAGRSQEFRVGVRPSPPIVFPRLLPSPLLLSPLPQIQLEAEMEPWNRVRIFYPGPDPTRLVA